MPSRKQEGLGESSTSYNERALARIVGARLSGGRKLSGLIRCAGIGALPRAATIAAVENASEVSSTATAALHQAG